MSSREQPVALYLVLGAPGSKRRAVLADLIDAGLPAGAKAAVMQAASERSDATDALLTKAGAQLGEWHFERQAQELPRLVMAVPEGVTHLFLLSNGRENPVDQVEALREWLPAQFVALARVITVLDAGLAQKEPALALWVEACLHYADVVLVTNVEGVESKWITAFENKFRDLFYPFLFEVVRRGETKNPAALLEPEARRMAQVFDEDIELADESDEEVAAAKAENDRFFARKQGGTRVIQLPDVAKFR